MCWIHPVGDKCEAHGIRRSGRLQKISAAYLRRSGHLQKISAAHLKDRTGQDMQ